jgi:NTE family protein
MTMVDESNSAPGRRKVALALQGGGSHGAFTWGVLDRMLEETTIEIIGVTGTSAGAMNAVALADGLVRGGPEQARQKLRQVWEGIGKMPGFGSFLKPLSGETASRLRLEYTPAYHLWDIATRNLSPYEFNPTNYNPLRDLLTQLIDFDRLRAQEAVQLMVCATNVRTATRRVFTNANISVDAVLASACLPHLFQAVEIDGEAYWDGGYTGNPALAALVQKMPNCDLIIVRIDPIQREEVPRSMRDIQDRLIEISFNSTFWLELSAIGLLLRFVDEGLLDRARFGRLHFHVIEAHPELEKIALSTKRNNYMAFLEYLFDLGRQTADAWLAEKGPALGQRSTIDLQKLLPVGA